MGEMFNRIWVYSTSTKKCRLICEEHIESSLDIIHHTCLAPADHLPSSLYTESAS